MVTMVRELCLCSEVRKNSSQLEEIFLLLPSEMVSELCLCSEVRKNSSQLEEIFLLLLSEMVRELCSSQLEEIFNSSMRGNDTLLFKLCLDS
jgi:hypothetical protein